MDFAMVVATSCFFQPGFSFADDTTAKLTGTWKVVSLITKFDRGDAVEPFGPNPKGRLVLTPEGHWIIIQTTANREPAKNLEGGFARFDARLFRQIYN